MQCGCVAFRSLLCQSRRWLSTLNRSCSFPVYEFTPIFKRCFTYRVSCASRFGSCDVSKRYVVDDASKKYWRGNSSMEDKSMPWNLKSSKRKDVSWKSFEDSGYDTGTGEEFSGPDTQATMDFQKNFYAESPAVSSRCQDEIDKWIADNKVTLNGDSLPRPVFELVEVGFPKIITDFLSKSFSKPTVIQSVSWPIALSGIDIVSVAMTGSGKTLAFLLPGIVHASMQSTREDPKSPAVVILLPTRELVQQVGDVCSHYCKLMGLRFACVFGGSSKIPQMNSLRRGIDILIATPGRLLDFLQDHVVKLKCCSFLVLDEADRMLDMGFEPQIRKIICRTRKDRQTLMFSATWPEGVRNLASEFQTNPAFSNVGSLGLAANHNITQVVKVIEEYKKQSTLMDLLNELVKESEKKVLVFVGTKRRADQLVTAVRRNGLTSLSIHGDKSQSERDRVLREFRSGRTPILLATNVAARGLDVNDIGCVINYDCPQNIADYVHRIGRTGRCENKGLAYTLFTPEDDLNAKDLIDVMKEADQKVPFELLRMSRIQKSERHRRSSDFTRTNSYRKGTKSSKHY